MFKVIIMSIISIFSATVYSKITCSQCVNRYIINHSDKSVNIYLSSRTHSFLLGSNVSESSSFFYDHKGKDGNLCIKVVELESKVTTFFYIRPNFTNTKEIVHQYYLSYNTTTLEALSDSSLDSKRVEGVDIKSSRVGCYDIRDKERKEKEYVNSTRSH